VRLIPVSAVGKGFSRPSDDNPHEMIINPDRQPRPENVEMPISCVLPDRLEAMLRDLQRKRQQEEARSTTVTPQLTWWQRMRGAVADVVATVLPHSLRNHPLVDDILKELSRPVRESLSEAHARSVELVEQKERAMREVRDAESAYGYLLRAFQERRHRLELEFPESRVEC
jgi:septal ring factor EnvC (AmiA/AmiB activator)